MKKLFTLFVAALCCANMFAEEQALPGKFTVNADGDQVQFSEGNLARNNNDGDLYFIGPQSLLSHYGSVRWVYFCWGTGNNPTAARVQVDNFVDWGVNPIGSDTEGNIWRTLSADEWQYLISGREHAEYLCGLAKITTQYEGLYPGLILFPDNLYVEPGYDSDGDRLNLPDGILFISYQDNSQFTYHSNNEYTESQWEALEQAGAVFMPESYFYDSDTYYNYQGMNAIWCWTSTPSANGNSSAKCLNITKDKKANNVIIDNQRHFSLPVRLVKDVQAGEGINNVQSDNVQCTKYIQNGQLFIEKNGKIFNAQGAEVK